MAHGFAISTLCACLCVLGVSAVNFILRAHAPQRRRVRRGGAETDFEILKKLSGFDNNLVKLYSWHSAVKSANFEVRGRIFTPKSKAFDLKIERRLRRNGNQY